MATSERALSVSDAMALAKGVLEAVRLTVVGEVSGCTIKPGYKAVYFSLKDDCALMPCLMWRDAYDTCEAELRDGQLVEVTGSFTAYAPKGRLQFQVRSVRVAGEGMLRLQVAALARRLEAEGLMAPERKRAIPAFPRRIGLVTSPRGKAIHDVIRTLRRRYPVAEVVIAGVQVEGEGAVDEIVRGLEALAAEADLDVIILGRGGGSYEDLMPFNAEEVARAVVASTVPVVTGIGHEPDTSIADMVADLRASTPTAAAEAVSPDHTDVDRRLNALRRLLARALAHRVSDGATRLAALSHRPAFRDASYLLGPRLQTVDLLADALGRALPAQLRRQREAVERARDTLIRVGTRVDTPFQLRVARVSEQVVAAGHAFVESAQRRSSLAAARLDDLSPLAILGRGYAVCYEEDGTVVRSAERVSSGDRVRIRLAEGRLGCRVEDIEREA